ncbi:MAG: glutamyl-tRNA amidotransferase [Candidatus Wildermuthbacteria bacterium RIFCSPHIGHO2_02_FULL_49_9]|uniref:Glutamyl-tRNA amidotransferase n=2 Tax=Candidatus Wildermuthiibacteriota TaxID=1817923 RepID=A0A1G2RFP1_9BACT|nr:MAG: glutamyl-tRNA amidotransferase [Candidatus Wildermuthbacteria bacterium RIFCSPHIGHO2_02_FULL_49_9]
MTLKQKIREDLNIALKKRESVRIGALRMLLAAMVNKEKEALRQARSKEELSDEEIQSVVATEAKKRREAIEAFLKGGRPELAEKEKQELDVLLLYLPEQLSGEEIRKLVKEAIAKTKAGSFKDMGKIMGVLAPQVKGKADGALVASIVKEILSS